MLLKAATIVIMASKASLIISTSFFSLSTGTCDNDKGCLKSHKCVNKRCQCKDGLVGDEYSCKIGNDLFVYSLQSGRNFGERVLNILCGKYGRHL